MFTKIILFGFILKFGRRMERYRNVYCGHMDMYAYVCVHIYTYIGIYTYIHARIYIYKTLAMKTGGGGHKSPSRGEQWGMSLLTMRRVNKDSTD